jgi:hypothetical protein
VRFVKTHSFFIKKKLIFDCFKCDEFKFFIIFAKPKGLSFVMVIKITSRMTISVNNRKQLFKEG